MKCLCATARRASRQLTRHYENELRAANVTPAQFELLGTLLSTEGLSQTELAAALSLDQTTLSRNLRVLLARQWIVPQSSLADRRRTRYVLTPAGRAAFRLAFPLWQRAQSQMQEILGREWIAVATSLDAISSALSD